MSKNQNLMSTTLATAVASILGRNVLAIAGEQQTKYTVSKLDIDGEPGTMKDKSKELFVLLQPIDGGDTATVVRLHPKNAATLVKGDETTAGGVKYKLEPLAADMGQTASADTGTSTETQSAESTSTEGQAAEANAEAGSTEAQTAEGSTTEGAAATGETTETAPQAKADKPSKKELAIDMYIEMANNGKERKDIIKAFKEVLELTQAGANTYYQNCASFKPGWTVRADEAEGDGAADGEGNTADAGAAEGEQAATA